MDGGIITYCLVRLSFNHVSRSDVRKKSEREEDKEKALKRVMEVAHTDGEDSFSRVKQESRL